MTNKIKQTLHFGSGRRGQVLILSTVSLFALFGVVGLSVDLGWASYKKIEVRTASESAAMAAGVYAYNNGSTCGANGVVCGATYTCANPPVSPPTTAMQAGCLYASANGYLNGGKSGRQTVTMIANNTAPPGVTGNSPSYWVKANISETIPGLFLFFNGMTGATVASQAIAGITNIPSGNCIYALNTGNTPDGFKISGSVTVTSNCGIYVNSSSTSGYDQVGSSNVNSTQILLRASAYNKTGSGSVTPTPTLRQAIVADPFADLPTPSFNGCAPPTVTTGGSESYSYDSTSGVHLSGSGSATMNPGVYCGGISISGSGNIAFNSGTYIINGNGFNWSGSGALTGSHVMFFITGVNGHTAAPLNVSGSGSITFSGPNSGTYEGILFYQDRNITYGAVNSFTGSMTNNCSGAFYFPSTGIKYAGSSTGHYQALVADTVTIVGSSNFLNDTSGTYTGLASTTTSIIY